MEKTYETLEPGLQAAMELLEREARNEESNSSIADGKDDEVDAKTCAHYAWAYRQAIKLLQEQRSRLSAYPSQCETKRTSERIFVGKSTTTKDQDVGGGLNRNA